MALLQALLTFLSRSLRRFLNAVFGWAVVALFGRSEPKQHRLLTLVVALAALWPLLLAGIVFPRVATFAIAFVPLVEDDATWPLRAVWIALTVAVPVTVGFAMAAKSPQTQDEPVVLRVLRGFPVTIALVGAFLVLFVTVPVLRIASLVRRRGEEHVPLITVGSEYAAAAAVIDEVLRRHELGAERARPPWWLEAPARLLQRLGGKAVRGHVPERLAYWRGPRLELALHPGDLLIRGEKKRTAVTHGLVDEAFASGPGFMTHDAEAQAIEKEIHRIWHAHPSRTSEVPSPSLTGSSTVGQLEEIAREVLRLESDYEQWQVVHRKVLQLGRRLRGEAPLLRSTVEEPLGASGR